MKSLVTIITRMWRWWFTPRSGDPTVQYRERALRFLLPTFVLLRIVAITNAYSDTLTAPPRYFPAWVPTLATVILFLLTFYFLLTNRVGWAGASFLLNWYLLDVFNLPADGYWNAGFQISLVLQIVMAVLLLQSRAILPFLIFHLLTFGIWGYWLDVNYYDPPLLSSGEPVSVFSRMIITLAAQESIILFIVLYLRLQMEKALRLQQSSIIELQNEIETRVHLQNERERFVQELEQRNAELERLAYTLSHELKSPLITIRGFMGYLREDALSGNVARLDRDLHRISEGTDKMLMLINELIDLMSVGRIVQDFTEFPLCELVNEAIDQLKEKIAQRRVTISVADNLPQVRGDRKRLQEVFQNLLDNSIKFMGDQPEPRIEIGVRRADETDLVFYVHDNGIGIEPRFSERIFGIFHKLDTMSEGTGIGLALVKRIIEVHGGTIWIESEGLGKGSTFCFTIPDGGNQEREYTQKVP